MSSPGTGCPPGRPPTRRGPPSPSTRCCPCSCWSGAATGAVSCAPTAGPPGSTAGSSSPYRRTRPPPARPLARTADPRPLLARAEEALARYRARGGGAGRRTAATREAFRGRTQGLRIGVVVDGESVWLYDAEHERWVYCDGARLSTYAVGRTARTRPRHGCRRPRPPRRSPPGSGDPTPSRTAPDRAAPAGTAGRPGRGSGPTDHEPTRLVPPVTRDGEPSRRGRPPSWSARQIAGYRVEREIGRGGMAVVYRAQDLRLDRTVALKLLAPELARNDTFRQPLHPRVAGGRRHRPSAHRAGLRGGRDGRRPLHRHAVRRRQRSAASPGPRGPAAGRRPPSGSPPRSPPRSTRPTTTAWCTGT